MTQLYINIGNIELLLRTNKLNKQQQRFVDRSPKPFIHGEP